MNAIYFKIGVCGFTLFAVGCMNLSPKYKQSELPVPPSFRNHGSAEELFGLPLWKEFYRDEVLQVLIELALEHNRDLKIATANIQQLQALHQLRKSDRIPNISSSLSFTSTRMEVEVEGALYESSNYTGTLLNMTSFEVDLWGRLKNLKEVSEANLKASFEAKRTVKISIINGTAEIYYLYLSTKERLFLHQSIISVYRELLSLVEKREKAGFARASDLAGVRADLAKVQAEEAMIKKDMHVYIAALQLMVGVQRDVFTILSENDTVYQNHIALVVPKNLSSFVLLNRPDVASAEYTLIARNADIGAARAAFLPSISLSGFLNSASISFNQLFEDRNSSYTFSIANSIFGQGRKANLDYANARYEESLAQYEKIIQIAFSEVYTQMQLIEAFRNELDANALRVIEQKKLLAYIEARYDAEISSYAEILSVLQDLVESEHALLTSESNQLLATIRLYKALGGGVRTALPSRLHNDWF